MGEIADMMLDGTLCEGCGEYIGEGDGYPQYCSEQCASDRGAYTAQIKGEKTSTRSEGKKRREKRRKKRKAQERKALLASEDDAGWKKHTEYHWSRTLCGLRFDFWPTGRKAMFNGVVYKNVDDVVELARTLKENLGKEPQ